MPALDKQEFIVFFGEVNCTRAVVYRMLPAGNKYRPKRSLSCAVQFPPVQKQCVLCLGFFRQPLNSLLGSCNPHYINLLLLLKNAFWYFRCWKVISSYTVFTYSIYSRPTTGLWFETPKWNSHNHILFLRFHSYELQLLFRNSCLQDCEKNSSFSYVISMGIGVEQCASAGDMVSIFITSRSISSFMNVDRTKLRPTFSSLS